MVLDAAARKKESSSFCAGVAEEVGFRFEKTALRGNEKVIAPVIAGLLRVCALTSSCAEALLKAETGSRQASRFIKAVCILACIAGVDFYPKAAVLFGVVNDPKEKLSAITAALKRRMSGKILDFELQLALYMRAN